MEENHLEPPFSSIAEHTQNLKTITVARQSDCSRIIVKVDKVKSGSKSLTIRSDAVDTWISITTFSTLTKELYLSYSTNTYAEKKRYYTVHNISMTISNNNNNRRFFYCDP